MTSDTPRWKAIPFMKTDTPRTDAFFNRTDIEWDDEVLFAQQLERELHDAEIRIQAEVSRIEMLNCELAASKAEVERLKEEVKSLNKILELL